MKISVDGVDLFELSEIQKKVIKHFINEDEFEEDMKRRLEWVLMHKYEVCFKELKQEWDDRLAENGVDMMPTNKDSYAQLVFSQPDYQDRKQRSMQKEDAI